MKERRLSCCWPWARTIRSIDAVQRTTADGGDYLGLAPSGEPDYARGWPVLQALLGTAEKPLTRRAISHAWPDSAAAPA